MTDVTNPGLSDPKAGVPTIRRFKGATSQDQGVPPFTPDCNGAASNNHFVEFINRVFSVYDKQTGKLLPSRVTDVEFWVIAGITSPGNIIDPRIVFIPDAGQGGQWLAVQIDLSTRGRVLIATTDPSDGSADPMVGRWKAQEFELRGLDFPMLGYDAKGVYIGVNSSQLPPPPPPTPPDKRSPQFVFIPRAKALAYPPQVGPADIKIIGPLHFEDYGDSLYPAIDQSGGDSPYGTLIGIDNLSRRHLTYSLFSPQSGRFHRVRVDLATKAQIVPLPVAAEGRHRDFNDRSVFQPVGGQKFRKIRGRRVAQLLAQLCHAEPTRPARSVAHYRARLSLSHRWLQFVRTMFWLPRASRPLALWRRPQAGAPASRASPAVEHGWSLRLPSKPAARQGPVCPDRAAAAVTLNQLPRHCHLETP